MVLKTLKPELFIPGWQPSDILALNIGTLFTVKK